MSGEMKHRFLCCNQETYEPLIWRQYGYWNADLKSKRVYDPPEWFNEETIKRAEDLAARINAPDLQVRVTTEFLKNGLRPNSWGASWELFDPNNPHIEGDKGAVCGCKSEASAKAYAMQRYGELKYLYDGDVEALLVYKKTGVACLPNWNTNEIDSWGFKLVEGKIIKSRVPRAKEISV